MRFRPAAITFLMGPAQRCGRVDSGFLYLIEDRFASQGQRRGGTMGAPHILVHDKKDTVGVVVVEGLRAGTDMLGVVTADNSDFRLTAKHDIPIGHKVALGDIKPGDTVWKYGQDIGKAIADIGK